MLPHQYVLDCLLGGHVTARIKGIRWWARVYVECWFDAHAQRHHGTLFQAHWTPSIARRLILTPFMLPCNNNKSQLRTRDRETLSNSRDRRICGRQSR